MNFKKVLRKNLVNIPGWRTNRKIVVIESDDWGSIRMPSREVYEFLLSKGLPVDKHYFLRNDCIESEEDLGALFEVLSSFKDIIGNYPVFTANAVVANPDFEKIKGSGMKEYYFEPFTETYKRYPNHYNSFELWKNVGMANKLLWPQFHGREHLNVKSWMRAINSGSNSEKLAFLNKVLLGMDVPNESIQAYNYMAAFEFDSKAHMLQIEQITSEGLQIFNSLFDFPSKSFVASCSIQGEHIDRLLRQEGVIYHQCGQQFRPIGDGKLKVVNKIWGQTNNVGQIYWRRNCTFEPSRNQDYDWVDSCLAEMKIAFRWGKPSVINSHRVNYIGSIFPKNRNDSLKSLKRLIKSAMHMWPDIEFLTSDALGDTISEARTS